jgi:hypothetical protein
MSIEGTANADLSFNYLPILFHSIGLEIHLTHSPDSSSFLLFGNSFNTLVLHIYSVPISKLDVSELDVQIKMD